MNLQFFVGAVLFCLGDLAILVYLWIENTHGWYRMYDRFDHVFLSCTGVMLIGLILLFIGFLKDRPRRY